jgi:serine/threonine-protein kinase HipA
MSGRQKSVEIYADLHGAAARMGTLYAQSSGRQEVFSFEYAAEWLRSDAAFAFDPDLQLLEGAQYPAQSRSNFGIFLDSAPDRWGRLLMQRRENLRARHEQRPARRLSEWDFLLGVHDETRLGALRLRSVGEGGEFLDSDRQLAAPPITSVRELQAASDGLERHIDDEESPEYARWLKQLVAPGSSLGGARPKTSVRDEAGELCIAKFPSRADTRNMAAWEMLAHRLAARCGVDLPPARLLNSGEREQSTFLVKRFDRTAHAGRRAFVSAMTLTQRRDGEPGASYLELVELLQRQGAETLRDTHQLFRRIVFSVLIHNTDDHLRNHGFFVEERGLRLSPAYDMNPSLDGDDLTLAINETETTCDVEIARAAHKLYALSLKEADGIVAEVEAAVKTWREEAEALRIRRSEQDQMAAAFTA